MSEIPIYAYLAYIALLLIALVASVWWRQRGRKSVRPFDMATERVMRTPGEGARQKIDQLNDEILRDVFVSFLAPIAIFLPFALILRWMPGNRSVATALVLAIPVVSLVVLVVLIRRMSQKIMERSDWHLGQYGERNVADNLDPLRQRKWRVFHDVPAERNGVKFNIDHVAVGPGGIFAIETKTPRRPEMANRSSENHVVEYDGERLRWPTGAFDYDKPRKAQARADYLRDWLIEQKIPVKEVFPILAIPFWYVRVPPNTDYRIPALNPGQLVAVIAARPVTLTRPEIETVAAKLEQHCRDVAF